MRQAVLQAFRPPMPGSFGGLPLMTTCSPLHDLPQPGEFIREIYLSELQLSVRDVASKLPVAPSTLNRILQGRSRATPEMTQRLSRCLGRSAESWLAMQDAYDNWQARQHHDLSGLQRCCREGWAEQGPAGFCGAQAPFSPVSGGISPLIRARRARNRARLVAQGTSRNAENSSILAEPQAAGRHGPRSVSAALRSSLWHRRARAAPSQGV